MSGLFMNIKMLVFVGGIIFTFLICCQGGDKQSKLKNEIQKTPIKQDTVQSIKKNNIETEVDTVKSEYQQINDYEIVNIHYNRTNDISRIFVACSKENSQNILKINRLITRIKEKYNINNRTNISFFTERQFANYKDVLFFNDNHPLDDTLYDKWKNEYYLGEYDFKTQKLILYPTNWKKRKVIELK